MALVVLLCGASSAYADESQKWCASGGLVINQVEDGLFAGDKFLDAYPEDVISPDNKTLTYNGVVYHPC